MTIVIYTICVYYLCDDLKVFASSESKLSRVMESTNTAMEDVRQEEKMSLEGAAKEYLHRMSHLAKSLV